MKMELSAEILRVTKCLHGLLRLMVCCCIIILLSPSKLYAQPSSLGVHIVRSPESAVAPNGDEVVFECEFNLDPERLAWRFRHVSARVTSAKNFVYLENSVYNITHEGRFSKLRVFVSPETLGNYQCVAWFGPAAIASVSARLTLVSISINQSMGYAMHVMRWMASPKNCILIRCGTVTSNPPAVWSFFRNGVKVPQQEVLTTNGALILNSVSTKDSGNYTCSAQNAITGVEVKLPQSIDLRVDYMDRRSPAFLTPPSNQVTASPGETVVLECPGMGSPPPNAVWSSPNVANIYNNRTKILSYGLQISDVLPEDYGTYVCRLDNGIAPALVLYIKLIVLEKPKILRGPATTLTNEGEPLELECSATGNPLPEIYWMINGEEAALDNETFPEDRRLVIKHVQKRHAGIVQCFAKNEFGEVNEASLLQVNPLQIQGEVARETLGHVPTRLPYDHSGNKGKGKRKHKIPNMIPPSRPNVTRLSDDSVMLRWYVPKNDGLPIQFFKVQYRMLGDNTRKIPRENWQTTNEEIPYGKRDRTYEGVKNFTSSVPGLKPDRNYRFRVIAVYSNNDNKEGNTSAKFFLQRAAALGPTKSNLPAPELLRIEALSENAIMLHWALPANPSNLVDGFYAYYRPSTSAGEYMKATVDGMKSRKFKVDLLEPATAYEFKLQSFNALAASEFSSILQGRTKKSNTTLLQMAPSVIPGTTTNQDNSIYPVVAGAAGGGILLLIATVAACLCMKRRKNSQSEDEDKPQLNHIQADFATPSVLGISQQHKGHRLNSVIPRMNITSNPLAHEADKIRNVMELRFMPNNTTNIKNNVEKNTNLTCKSTKLNEALLNDNKDDCDIDRGTRLKYDSKNAHNHQNQLSSSSCETLEAGEGFTTGNSSDGYNLSADGAVESHHGLHHAQPYKQNSLPCTPTMLYKRGEYQQTPPPIPPHQNNHQQKQIQVYNMQHQHYNQSHQQPNNITSQHLDQHLTSTSPPNLTQSLDQQRRTLDRSARNLHFLQNPSTASSTSAASQQNQTHYHQLHHYQDTTLNCDGLQTRIPSLRRTRCISGNTNNSNGGIGIPIAPGSPLIQHSPMPVRAAMTKRNRLGSHNDNISSGSLNSIEV